MSHIADLTDPDQVAALIAAVEAKLGPVEILDLTTPGTGAKRQSGG